MQEPSRILGRVRERFFYHVRCGKIFPWKAVRVFLNAQRLRNPPFCSMKSASTVIDRSRRIQKQLISSSRKYFKVMKTNTLGFSSRFNSQSLYQLIIHQNIDPSINNSSKYWLFHWQFIKLLTLPLTIHQTINSVSFLFFHCIFIHRHWIFFILISQFSKSV